MLNPSPEPSSCIQLCFLLAVIKDVPQVTTGDPVASWRNQPVTDFVPFLPAARSFLPGTPASVCPPEAPGGTSPCPAGTYGIQRGALLLSLKCFGKEITWKVRKLKYENGFYYCSNQSNNPRGSLMQRYLKNLCSFSFLEEGASVLWEERNKITGVSYAEGGQASLHSLQALAMDPSDGGAARGCKPVDGWAILPVIEFQATCNSPWTMKKTKGFKSPPRTEHLYSGSSPLGV